jgi:hypothetical protein
MRWILLFLICAQIASARQIEMPQMFTVEGVRYTGLKYISHDASRLRVAHDGGEAELKISELPIGLRFQLGYSERRAAEAEAERGIKAAEQKRPVTPDEIRARAAQRQREAAVERYERDTAKLKSRRADIQQSRKAFEARQRAFKNPQTFDDLAPAELPEVYGGRPTGSSSRAVAARKAWDKKRAIDIENILMKQGNMEKAMALRQSRLQQEANESLEKLARETERLRQEVESQRWRR